MSAVWNERGQVFPPRRVGKKLLFPTRNHRKRTARNTCKTDALQSPSLSLSLAVIKRTRNYPKYIQQTIVCTRALRWIDTGEPRPITRYREEMKSSLKLVRPVSWTRPLNGQKPPRYFSPIFLLLSQPPETSSPIIGLRVFSPLSIWIRASGQQWERGTMTVYTQTHCRTAGWWLDYNNLERDERERCAKVWESYHFSGCQWVGMARPAWPVRSFFYFFFGQK